MAYQLNNILATNVLVHQCHCCQLIIKDAYSAT